MRVFRSRLVGVHMDTTDGMLVDAVRMDGRHRHGAVDDATGGREDSNEHCAHEPRCGATTDRNAHGSPPQTYWSPRRNDAQRGTATFTLVRISLHRRGIREPGPRLGGSEANDARSTTYQKMTHFSGSSEPFVGVTWPAIPATSRQTSQIPSPETRR